MLIKFFKNGQGGGAAPVDYLVEREVVAYDDNRNALRDSNGKVLVFKREPLPEVLHGDPDQVRHLIDACKHQWSYRAGVISFTGEDAPSDNQQREVMKQFEGLAFAGLEPEQSSILWVRHSHEERVELHFVTPRMELTTGKSLNIAPPHYQKSYDALRDVLNKEHQWNDPQAPEHACEVKSIIEDVKRGKGREQLHDWVLDRIEDSSITNRGSMIEALNKAGFDIPRQGKAYITVRDPESDERWRLKGDIFREDWSRENATGRALERTSANSAQTPDREPSRSGSRLDALVLGSLRERLQEVTEKRAEYNRGRYPVAAEYEQSNEQKRETNLSDGHTVQPNRYSDELRSELVLGNQHDRDITTSQPFTNGIDSQPDRQRVSTELGQGPYQVDRLSYWKRVRKVFANLGKRIIDEKGRSISDSTRTRINDIRRKIDGSIRAIGDSVQRIGREIESEASSTPEFNREVAHIRDRVSSIVKLWFVRISQQDGQEHEYFKRNQRKPEGSSSSLGGIGQKKLNDLDHTPRRQTGYDHDL